MRHLPSLLGLITWMMCSTSILPAQRQEDIVVVRRVLVAGQESAAKRLSRPRGLVAMAFRGYKALLSSQDYRRCGFYPSCSAYAVEAIERRGVVQGFFLALDRYSRCHGSHRSFYAWDSHRQLSVDTVAQR